MSLSKDDLLPKVSSLRVFDQNKHRNKLPGVKGIGRVSPMKSKSKVTGKTDSPTSSEVIKESDKAPVVKEKPDNPKDKESDKAPVLAAVVSGKLAVDEKDNRKVMSKVSKVSDESDKATVVAPVLKEKPTDVIEKLTVIKESDKASVIKERKPADVIKKSTVVNEKEKLTVDVTSKVAKDKEKTAVDVMSKVGKSKAVVHKYKALNVVSKDKPKGITPSVVGKGNASSVVGMENDKPSVVKGKLPTELPKKKH
nr:hypothetical protein [Tanacetum cinerariifolium]